MIALQIAPWEGCPVHLQITLVVLLKEFSYSVNLWNHLVLSIWPGLTCTLVITGGDGTRRSRETNTALFNCCWKITWHALYWCSSWENSMKTTDCSPRHGWGKWSWGSVSDSLMQLGCTSTDGQGNCKCSRSRMKGLNQTNKLNKQKQKPQNPQGSFVRIRAVNKSKTFNNSSSVLISELFFKMPKVRVQI